MKIDILAKKGLFFILFLILVLIVVYNFIPSKKESMSGSKLSTLYTIVTDPNKSNDMKLGLIEKLDITDTNISKILSSSDNTTAEKISKIQNVVNKDFA
jgi:hypothetical protein